MAGAKKGGGREVVNRGLEAGGNQGVAVEGHGEAGEMTHLNGR